MNNQTTKGLILVGAGYLFTYIETVYFGWNMTPQSTSEAMCDATGGLMVVVGLALIIGARNQSK